MLMKFFIFAVTIIGIATRLSSGEHSAMVLIKAYNDTMAEGIHMEFVLWRAADCPNADIANRAMSVVGETRVCEFCVCGVAAAGITPAPSNCNQIPCFPINGPAPSPDVANSWDSTSATLPVWTSIKDATAFQIYTVDDGLCYATDIHVTTGRTMRCFAH